MKEPLKASPESDIPTDDQAEIPSDSSWDPATTTPKPDRATYQAARRAELDRLRRPDLVHRELL